LYQIHILKRKGAPFIFLALLALAVFLVVQYKKSQPPPPVRKETGRERQDPGRRNNDPTAPPSDVDTRSGLIRNPSNIRFSKHARCRMDCRHIDESEIREVLAAGTINSRKTQLNASPDPKYAVEGRTHDGQQIRLIVAQSPRGSTIVTVIDLDTRWKCQCPGDQ
jgi:Domain of unknown function (DUF4258)